MLVILITHFSFPLLNGSYLWGFSSLKYIAIKKQKKLNWRRNNRFYFLPVHHFSAWPGKLPPPPPVSCGWPPLPGFREMRGDSRWTKAARGGRAGGFLVQQKHYSSLCCLSNDGFSRLQPPVVSLLAPRVTSRPLPPLPRCPALGSSSVCCKPNALPVHPAMPGGWEQVFLWFFMNMFLIYLTQHCPGIIHVYVRFERFWDIEAESFHILYSRT